VVLAAVPVQMEQATQEQRVLQVKEILEVTTLVILVAVVAVPELLVQTAERQTLQAALVA
jgi:hypothetical protein